MGVFWQVVLALVFPIAWGLGSAWLFDKINANRARSADKVEADAS